MGGPCPQGKVTGVLVSNGGATAASRAGMAIRERPTGNGDSTPDSDDNWSLGEELKTRTWRESVVSGRKWITPPFLGTERTRRVPVALVMAILVGREASRDSV